MSHGTLAAHKGLSKTPRASQEGDLLFALKRDWKMLDYFYLNLRVEPKQREKNKHPGVMTLW